MMENTRKKTSLGKRFRYNKGALVSCIVLLIIILSSLLAPFIAPYDPSKMDLKDRNKAPFASDAQSTHVMGTDPQGRDVFTRLLYGSQITLRIAFVVTIFGAVLGTLLGLIAGYFGNWADMIIMRIVDIWSASPIFLISLTVVMILKPGERSLIIAFLFNSWTLFCRMARSKAMAIRSSDMVESGRAIGASTKRILFRHLLPSIISPMITTFIMELAHYIIAEANLSFLGFGVVMPAISWGSLIADGKAYISSSWWMVVFPGLMIGITVLCLTLVGNWLRDEFDPLVVKR